MRLISLILTLITASINAQQNDQAIMTRSNVNNPLVLEVTSAIVISEDLPLRIQIPSNILDENILSFEAYSESTDPKFIEVMHYSILDRFTRLMHLSLSNVRMRRITLNSFRNCSITSATLALNLLQEIPAGAFRNCGNLSSLHLNDNQITSITPESFQGLNILQLLDISSNQITSLNAESFSQIPNLRSLFMARNNIREIVPGMLPSRLFNVDMTDCGITQLHPDSFRNSSLLAILIFNQNPITEFPPGVFTNLTSIHFFFMAQTNVRRLNSNAFGYHPMISSFVIQSSGLDEIQPGFFDTSRFPHLFDFNSFDNLCANVSLTVVHEIDFNENRVLHQCFANWFVPSTSVAP